MFYAPLPSLMYVLHIPPPSPPFQSWIKHCFRGGRKEERWERRREGGREGGKDIRTGKKEPQGRKSEGHILMKLNMIHDVIDFVRECYTIILFAIRDTHECTHTHTMHVVAMHVCMCVYTNTAGVAHHVDCLC